MSKVYFEATLSSLKRSCWRLHAAHRKLHKTESSPAEPWAAAKSLKSWIFAVCRRLCLRHCKLHRVICLKKKWRNEKMRNAWVFTFVVTSNPCAQNVISHQWLMPSYLKDSVSLYICSCASACQFVCFVLFLFWIVPWYLKVIQGFCAFWKAISQLIVSFWSSLFFYSSICQDRQSSTSSSFLLWICVIFISRSIRVYQHW